MLCFSAYILHHIVAKGYLQFLILYHFRNAHLIYFDLQKIWFRSLALPFPSSTNGTLLHLSFSLLPIHKWREDDLISQEIVRTKWPNVYIHTNYGHNLIYSELWCKIRRNSLFLPNAYWSASFLWPIRSIELRNGLQPCTRTASGGVTMADGAGL